MNTGDFGDGDQRYCCFSRDQKMKIFFVSSEVSLSCFYGIIRELVDLRRERLFFCHDDNACQKSYFKVKQSLRKKGKKVLLNLREIKIRPESEKTNIVRFS